MEWIWFVRATDMCDKGHVEGNWETVSAGFHTAVTLVPCGSILDSLYSLCHNF